MAARGEVKDVQTAGERRQEPRLEAVLRFQWNGQSRGARAAVASGRAFASSPYRRRPWNVRHGALEYRGNLGVTCVVMISRFHPPPPCSVTPPNGHRRGFMTALVDV